jgi:hypothetical protein
VHYVRFDQLMIVVRIQLLSKCFAVSLTLLLSVSLASAQTAKKDGSNATLNNASAEPAEDGQNKDSAVSATNPPTVWVHLVGGRKMQVDDVTEAADGIWYTRNNVSTFLEAARVKRIERSEERALSATSDTLSGTGRWKISDSARVENFFLFRFKRSLPLTAFGQSDLHTRWGLDHRHGIDVGLHPDSVEGKALIQFLLTEEIPFLAFRGSVPGVATGPHIHIGNGSPRMRDRQ